MTPGAVNRNAHQFSIKTLEILQDFVVERHLIAANGTPVCRIKREHHISAAKIAQARTLIRGAAQIEIGSLRAGRQLFAPAFGMEIIVLSLRVGRFDRRFLAW